MRKLLGLLLLAATTGLAPASNDPPLLLRRPTLSATDIVFNYGGNLWIVSRAGGDAKRLTSGVGRETDPAFSPDGRQVAFTGEYDGNQDVYVVPATGGVPKRLTYHPGADRVVGWTPDGKRILFLSPRSAVYPGSDQLFSVGTDGGASDPFPIPIVADASLSPDGSHLAYIPFDPWEPYWKRYRGGQTTPIWIADLKDSHIERVPRENSNDTRPMWIGDTIYFLSDRQGAVTLFAYDTKTRQVSQVVQNNGLDFKYASPGPGAIVIEQFGALKLYDLASHLTTIVPVRVAGDLPQVRSRFVKVEPKAIHHPGLSPSGARAVMEAWGEIFTVPSDKGDIRNLTRSPAVADRSPAWSPDGRYIAYFSDGSGEYELEIRDQRGEVVVKRISLGAPPSFYYAPVWSPNSKMIAYSDNRLNLWYVDLDKGVPVKVDTDLYNGFDDPPQFTQSWSPDSKWLAYTRQLPSFFHNVYVHSVERGASLPITDGMSDALYPVWDPNGKYLYFTASTDLGASAAVLDLSSYKHPVTRSVYVAVLSKDQASPLAPESDEEKIKADAGGEDSKSRSQPKAPADASGKKVSAKDSTGKPNVAPAVTIDEPGLSQRILALPVPARNYTAMSAGKSGVLFIAEGPPVITEDDQDDLQQTLYRWDLEKRKSEKFLEGVNEYAVSFDGEKLLYRSGAQWSIAGTKEPPSADAKPKDGEGPLKLDGLAVYVEPREMWRQMYREAWRIERDFFYDPHYHGLDLAKASARYAPYLDGLADRDELNYLFEEALGEMSVGHLWITGGDRVRSPSVYAGLLGADYTVTNGRYQIAKIYDGENWNPGLQAPLTQPGVNVSAGEYILAVNGRELRASDDIYSFFEKTAGTQVVLRVGADPSGRGARNATVVPVASERNLRQYAWVEGNRRTVAKLSGGRVGYVYMPNTAGAGYDNFNRYFFAQVGKEAVIIDERFNGGGALADYVIDALRRPLMNKVAFNVGADWSSPSGAIFGPKVMIINEESGSGGDAMPWYFRRAGIGPLVGKKTWGGLVGWGNDPKLIDGGSVVAPRGAIYGLNGEWEVENRGIAPDYDVDLDPMAVRQGHDPQIEKAVEVVLQLMKDHPAPTIKRPPFPNYHQSDSLGVKP